MTATVIHIRTLWARTLERFGVYDPVPRPQLRGRCSRCGENLGRFDQGGDRLMDFHLLTHHPVLARLGRWAFSIRPRISWEKDDTNA